MNDRPADIVRNVYAAFGRGDLPAVLGALSPDVEWIFPDAEGVPWAGRRRGRDGAAAFFAGLLGAADPLAFEPRDFIAEGERVAVTGSERMRIKATGRTYFAEWVHVWIVRGGAVVSFQEYTDTAAIRAALEPSPS